MEGEKIEDERYAHGIKRFYEIKHRREIARSLSLKSFLYTSLKDLVKESRQKHACIALEH